MRSLCCQLLSILQRGWCVGGGTLVAMLPANATPASIRAAEYTFSPFFSASAARGVSASVAVEVSVVCAARKRIDDNVNSRLLKGKICLQVTPAFPAPAMETGTRYPLHWSGALRHSQACTSILELQSAGDRKTLRGTHLTWVLG